MTIRSIRKSTQSKPRRHQLGNCVVYVSGVAASAFPYPTTMEEAKRFQITPGKNEFRFRYSNASAANIKVKVLRVFK